VTVNFKDMLHRIHTGEELNGDYTVYGFGNVAHDFTDRRFPGDRRECTICHVSGSVDLPLPDEAEPTVISQDGAVVDVIQPERAACTSCHDALLSNVHTVLNTDPASGVESCAVCHGPSAEFAVAVLHEREP